MKKLSFKSLIKIIIGAVVLAGVLTAVAIFVLKSGKMEMNPEGTIGNTAGNLNNGGYYCEYNGLVYFANPSDSFKLYSMNPDETNVTKVFDMSIKNILAGGKYLYFYTQPTSGGEAGIGTVISSKSLIQTDLNGRNDTSMSRDNISYFQLVGNYIYMLSADGEGNHFSKMKIDKSDIVPLSNMAINPACAKDDMIYYSGVDTDHYLYAIDTIQDIPQVIFSYYVFHPSIDGDYVYFMDVENNYRLCRYNLYTEKVDVLTEDRVDCYNVGYGYVYYQKNSLTDPQLMCMNEDGSNVHSIANGNFTAINMTSKYVYFKKFGDDLNVYHSALGATNHSPFTPPADKTLKR